jgi:hypothetical protein
MKSFTRIALGGAALLAISAAFPGASYADTLLLTSCHVTGSSCDGGSVSDLNAFGSVELTQSGNDVIFNIKLNNGNRFVETGAGGKDLFDFNDAITGSTVTDITATLNGVTTSLALTGAANQPPFQADGFGDFTAFVACANPADCNGGSTPNINDLHFTVTNVTIAQLETTNASGVIMVADILCGASQPGCTGGLTGPVDVSQVPGPVVGAGLPGLIAACTGLVALARRRRKLVV